MLRSRVAAMFGAVLVMIGCSPRGYEQLLGALPDEGKPIPTFEFPLLAGETVSSDGLLDHTVVIALWSSTCGASRTALASLAALSDDYADRGIQMLVLADDAQAETVRLVLDSAGIQLPLALASGRLTSVFAPSKRYPWNPRIALPAFLVIDHDGIVRARMIGIEQDPAARMTRLRSTLDMLDARQQ